MKLSYIVIDMEDGGEGIVSQVRTRKEASKIATRLEMRNNKNYEIAKVVKRMKLKKVI